MLVTCLQLLAERNLCIASTSRLIDDVPTRTELIQYERRFAECYDQVQTCGDRFVTVLSHHASKPGPQLARYPSMHRWH